MEIFEDFAFFIFSLTMFSIVFFFHCFLFCFFFFFDHSQRKTKIEQWFSFLFSLFFICLFSFFSFCQSSEQTPKPVKNRSEIHIVKVTIFLGEISIFAPRWTEGGAHLRVAPAFMFCHLSFSSFSIFLKTMCFFFSLFFFFLQKCFIASNRTEFNC